MKRKNREKLEGERNLLKWEVEKKKFLNQMKILKERTKESWKEKERYSKIKVERK